MMEIPRRIRKYLRDHTTLSIEQIVQRLNDGRVELSFAGGPKVRPTEETLVFEDDTVFLDGRALPPDKQASKVYVLFKPKGVITTARDPDGKRDLGPWLARLPAGYFPVGRLDRDTTGALLLANDGDLATAILRPEHKLSKLYWLWLNESLNEDDARLSEWLSGMPLLGGIARAERVEILAKNDDFTELLVTLREGKNRQIRRMCRKSDFRLLHLHRKSVGPIDLGGLQAGEMRELTNEELTALWSEVGGKTIVRRAQLQALERKAEELRKAGTPHLRLEAWLEHGSFASANTAPNVPL